MINKYMSKDKDSQLIWENYSNKFRGPGSPGVNLARGYLLQALELIEDQDVHLCADSEALQTTIHACQSAIEALSHDSHEVNEEKKKGKYDDGDDEDERCDHVPCNEGDKKGKYDDGDDEKERCDYVPCGEGAREDMLSVMQGRTSGKELDRGDEAGDYVAFLRNMARELVSNDMPEDGAFENVLSHPFEETYGEYLRTRGVAGVYTAAKAHIRLAEQMGAYHEVDMNALQNWKYS